jgi:hypothetical protein
MNSLPKYVLISQGIVDKFRTIEEYRNFITENPHKKDYFYELDEPQRPCPWAMGCFEVNNDGTIGKFYSGNWDTSG